MAGRSHTAHTLIVVLYTNGVEVSTTQSQSVRSPLREVCLDSRYIGTLYTTGDDAHTTQELASDISCPEFSRFSITTRCQAFHSLVSVPGAELPRGAAQNAVSAATCVAYFTLCVRQPCPQLGDRHRTWDSKFWGCRTSSILRGLTVCRLRPTKTFRNIYKVKSFLGPLFIRIL